jgi:hypothetical protein
MDKMDFMGVVKAILEETDNDELQIRREELKAVIDSMVTMEIGYYHAGLR